MGQKKTKNYEATASLRKQATDSGAVQCLDYSADHMDFLISSGTSRSKQLKQALALMKYVPPTNFAPVERRLYRSAAPLPISFPFLKLLGIKTIIWLAYEDPSDQLLDFLDDNDVRLEHLGLLGEGAKPWDPIHASTLQEALELIIDLTNYPVLLCCGMGRHRTGAVVGCLRKFQGWSFASLADEYQRFTGLKSERSNVELTVENFDLSAITAHLLERKRMGLPIPSWLDWKLEQLEKQEKLKSIEVAEEALVDQLTALNSNETR